MMQMSFFFLNVDAVKEEKRKKAVRIFYIDFYSSDGIKYCCCDVESVFSRTERSIETYLQCQRQSKTLIDCKNKVLQENFS